MSNEFTAGAGWPAPPYNFRREGRGRLLIYAKQADGQGHALAQILAGAWGDDKAEAAGRLFSASAEMFEALLTISQQGQNFWNVVDLRNVSQKDLQAFSEAMMKVGRAIMRAKGTITKDGDSRLQKSE
jgi:hypothetical protein